MSIRCYIPTTLTALRTGLAAVRAVAPDARGRELGGDELEAREFDAMCIAAALAATQSFDHAAGPVPQAEGAGDEAREADAGHYMDSVSPRAVVAYDAPAPSAEEDLAPGFVLVALEEVDMTAVASIHLDEAEVWEEAVDIAADRGHEAAEDHLGDSDLLWFDVTELADLLRERD